MLLCASASGLPGMSAKFLESVHRNLSPSLRAPSEVPSTVQAVKETLTDHTKPSTEVLETRGHSQKESLCSKVLTAPQFPPVNGETVVEEELR